jgi:hypothetical protein
MRTGAIQGSFNRKSTHSVCVRFKARRDRYRITGQHANPTLSAVEQQSPTTLPLQPL